MPISIFNTRVHLAAGLFIMILPCLISGAQGKALENEQLPSAPAYDVISVKLSKSMDTHVDVDSDDYHYAAKNIRLKQLIQDAFEIPEARIEGIPDKLKGVRFDIIAKLLDTDPNDVVKIRSERPQMDRSLLRDRFKLKYHIERRNVFEFNLRVGPNGIRNLRLSNAQLPSIIRGTGVNRFEAQNVSMAEFAKKLSASLQTDVIDGTGLQGGYDFTFEWSQENADGKETGNGLPIPDALKSQLGLFLQRGRGQVDILVVDHASLPEPD